MSPRARASRSITSIPRHRDPVFQGAGRNDRAQADPGRAARSSADRPPSVRAGRVARRTRAPFPTSFSRVGPAKTAFRTRRSTFCARCPESRRRSSTPVRSSSRSPARSSWNRARSTGDAWPVTATCSSFSRRSASTGARHGGERADRRARAPSTSTRSSWKPGFRASPARCTPCI